MSKHRPFTLLIEMGTPIAIGAHAIHLDSLLWFSIGARFNKSDNDFLNRELEKCLSLDDKHGVFKCSAMMLVATAEHGVCVAENVRVDMASEHFYKNSPAVQWRIKRAVLTGGPMKKRLEVREAYSTPYVAFHAVGNPERCQKLLCWNLPGIGKDARTGGGGEIVDVTVLDNSSTTNWLTDGTQYVRSIPVTGVAEMNQAVGNVPLRPPYYSRPKVRGYLPRRVNVTDIYRLGGTE